MRSKSRDAKLSRTWAGLDALGTAPTFSFESNRAKLTCAGETSCFSAILNLGDIENLVGFIQVVGKEVAHADGPNIPIVVEVSVSAEDGLRVVDIHRLVDVEKIEVGTEPYPEHRLLGYVMALRSG